MNFIKQNLAPFLSLLNIMPKCDRRRGIICVKYTSVVLIQERDISETVLASVG